MLKRKVKQKLKKEQVVGYDKTKLTTVNLSDAIRLVLIEKLGGWYSDLDMLFLKPIEQFKNALGGDNFNEKQADEDPNYLGEKLSNAIFHFEKGHPFIQKSLKYFPKIFTGEWGSGGPSVFQKSLENVCNYQQIPKMMKNEVNAENCQGVTVLPPK